MRTSRLMRGFLGLGAVCLLFGSSPRAQVSRERLEGIRARMQDLKQFFDSLSQEERRALSRSAQNSMQLARTWDDIEEQMGKELPQRQRLEASTWSQLQRQAGHGGARRIGNFPQVLLNGLDSPAIPARGENT